MSKSVSIKWVLMFVIPVFLVLVIGYVHVRTVNTTLESKLFSIQDEHQIFSGEVYRLRQLVEEREAKIKFLRDTELERYLIKVDGGYFWFFHRQNDNTWYVDAENSPSLNIDQNFRLLLGGQEIGTFRARASVVGLQKIGIGFPDKPFEILSAPVDQDWRQNSELIYLDQDGVSVD